MPRTDGLAWTDGLEWTDGLAQFLVGLLNAPPVGEAPFEEEDDTLPFHKAREHLLYYAVKYENVAVLKLLLQFSGNPNLVIRKPCDWQTLTGNWEMDGWTILHWAALNGNHVDVMSALIEGNADLNFTTPTMMTPLHHALLSKNLDGIKVLLQRKALLTAPPLKSYGVTLNGVPQCALSTGPLPYLLNLTNSKCMSYQKRRFETELMTQDHLYTRFKISTLILYRFAPYGDLKTTETELALKLE